MVIHWVTMIVEGAEERGERGQEGRYQAALFYKDNGIVASSDPCWHQGVLSTLVGLFDRLFIRTIFGKTVVIVCRPCQVAGTQLEATYRRRITGEVPTYWE